MVISRISSLHQISLGFLRRLKIPDLNNICKRHKAQTRFLELLNPEILNTKLEYLCLLLFANKES